MKILAAVARALATMVAVVMVMVWEAGKWVWRQRPGHQQPDPGALEQAYVEMGKTDAPDLIPAADRRVMDVQSIAYALVNGETIKDDWLVSVSEQTTDWLGTLTPTMLQLVARSDAGDLKAHMAGKKAIRGLLAYDPGSVAAYAASVRMEQQRNRRPTRAMAPDLPMPAFG